jgi:hypothetical protein
MEEPAPAHQQIGAVCTANPSHDDAELGAAPVDHGHVEQVRSGGHDFPMGLPSTPASSRGHRQHMVNDFGVGFGRQVMSGIGPNRYPWRPTVTMIRGSAGSVSSLRRSRWMKVRK